MMSASARANHRTGPPINQPTPNQVETVARDIGGTVVGFWTPAIYQGIAVAGLHLHFPSKDRSISGHVLDLAAEFRRPPRGGLRSLRPAPADGRSVPPHGTHPRRGPSHRRGRGRYGGIRRGTVLIPNASEAGAYLVRRDAESLERVRAGRLTLAGELGVADPDELAAPLLHHAVDEHRVDAAPP